MEPTIKIFGNQLLLARELVQELQHKTRAANENRPFTLALSGGSTPETLFSLLGNQFSSSINWDHILLFWGDERCVPPDHEESNYGQANKIFMNKINIPQENIFRIKGEDEPEIEAERYSKEILEHTKSINGLPSFDFVLLGIGNDGHTASIFPDQMKLLVSDKICEVSNHPVTQQKRITLTGKVLNNADTVAFLVSGENKAEIVWNIINNTKTAKGYPAAHIFPSTGKLEWFLDHEAATLL